MRRLFKIEASMFYPVLPNGDYCVEAFETVRQGRRNRILHFGLAPALTKEHIDWLNVVLGAEVESLVLRTTGIADKLVF